MAVGSHQPAAIPVKSGPTRTVVYKEEQHELPGWCISGFHYPGSAQPIKIALLNGQPKGILCDDEGCIKIWMKRSNGKGGVAVNGPMRSAEPDGPSR